MRAALQGLGRGAEPRRPSVALQIVYICILSSLLFFFSPENKITSWWGEGVRWYSWER